MEDLLNSSEEEPDDAAGGRLNHYGYQTKRYKLRHEGRLMLANATLLMWSYTPQTQYSGI